MKRDISKKSTHISKKEYLFFLPFLVSVNLWQFCAIIFNEKHQIAQL